MSVPKLLDDLDGPALSPPPSVEANFSTKSHAETWYYVCAVLCTVIPGSFIVLRMYTKVSIVRKVDLTDCKRFAANLKHFF
jgi:hypothetical protein